MAKNLRSLTSILSLILFTSLVACSKSKNTGIDAAGVAAISGSSDAVAGSDEESKTLEDCETSAADDEAEGEDEDEDLELKSDKSKDVAAKKDCPVSSTESLAPGQKLYTSNCQSCHGALPGQKQGSTALEILAASTLAPHKSISPWPAGAGSTLSAQDAAASLAAALK